MRNTSNSNPTQQAGTNYAAIVTPIVIGIVVICLCVGLPGLFLVSRSMSNSQANNNVQPTQTLNPVQMAQTEAGIINQNRQATQIVDAAMNGNSPTATSTNLPLITLSDPATATPMAPTNSPVPTFTQTLLPSPTVTFTSTPAGPAATLSVLNTAAANTLEAMPTSTVAASDAKSVYDTVVSLCQSGLSTVQVGMVIVNCSDSVLPRPTGTDTVTNEAYELPDLSGMDKSCPTNGEMFAAHGWGTNGVKAVKDGLNVEWEGCGKWQVQAVGIGTFRLHMLVGYQYTVTRADGLVVVYYGDGSWITVWGSTIRYLPSYTTADQAWVHDPMVLMIREYNYGVSMDPKYGTINGNLDIPQWTQPDINQVCPNDVFQAAAILGGDDWRFWTKPDWSGGAWTFNSKGDGFHHFTHPGAGYFDVWTPSTGATSVYASGKELFETRNFEEGSYHCP